MLLTNFKNFADDRIRNAEVFQKVNKECKVMTTIKRRKHQYLRYITRGEEYSLLRDIIQGKIKGKKKYRATKDILAAKRKGWLALFTRAAVKVTLAMVISSVH